MSDLSNIGAEVEDAAGGNAPFNDDLSYIESVKSFPMNTNIRARLTFRSGDPSNINSVPDPRSISVSIHYTLAQLPANPMKPRLGDDRVGNFMTMHKNFSNLDSTFFARRVNRWRLEPGERVGDRWRPVAPITYYIDHSVPDDPDERFTFADSAERATAWRRRYQFRSRWR